MGEGELESINYTIVLMSEKGAHQNTNQDYLHKM